MIMKKLQYIALATIISVWALVSTTFADNAGMNNDSMNKMNNKSMFKNHVMSWAQMGSWMEMKWQVMFEKFLKTDLTDVDKVAIAAIKTNLETAMRILMESMKPEVSSISQADMQTKMAELKTKIQVLHDQLIADLIPYIATDKAEEFKVAMSKMPVMGKWEINWQKNGMDNGKQNDKNENYKNWQKNDNNDNKKSQLNNNILPASVNKALETKLATFTTDADKITWLTGVNSKIDVLLTKTLSIKNKNLLIALRELISQKIDSINWTSTDIDSILDILK